MFLGTQVDEVSANRVCAQLLVLSAEDPRTDISLYINSPGGSVTAGLAIFDTMRLIPNDVATLAMGFAASMGQFLLTVGTPGKRYALPNARIMMLQPSGGAPTQLGSRRTSRPQILLVAVQSTDRARPCSQYFRTLPSHRPLSDNP